MRTTVAGLLLLAVGACGQVELAYDQPYCIVYGDDPERPVDSDCGPFQAVVFREGGTVEKLVPGEFAFVESGSWDGATVLVDDLELTLRPSQGALRIKELERAWLVSSDPRLPRLKRLDEALRQTDLSAPLEGEQPKYIDTPLCYSETRYINGRESSRNNHCDYGGVNFLSSLGVEVSLSLSSLEADELDWYVSRPWQNNSDGVPEIELQVDMSWELSATGYPTTGQERVRQERTGYFQRYDPNRRAIELSYRPYTGSDRIAATDAYLEQIVPRLRRVLLVQRHIPELRD